MKNADVADKLEWLTTKRQDLVLKHRGQWVVIDPEHDKVFANDELHPAVEEFHKEHPGETPCIFLIPSLDADYECY
ncbi:hypothetical protein HY642_01190 [Candidatus Woesearchaeota archaeon]|nr:hypothetical protein [Candidatus Woesearchaeota archaeon]